MQYEHKKKHKWMLSKFVILRDPLFVITKLDANDISKVLLESPITYGWKVKFMKNITMNKKVPPGSMNRR